MIGKFGGKQSLEEAMMYLIVIAGVGLGLAMVGAWIEDEANTQIESLEENAAKNKESVLNTSGYYDKSYSAKLIVKDMGEWMKLIGVLLLAVGLIMMRTAKVRR